MRKFIVILLVFALLTALIIYHSAVMHRFGETAAQICEKIEENVGEENWSEAEKGLSRLESLWEKRRTWAALTVRTNIIEEIDISLEQSAAYAKIKQKPDFLGEFIMLKRLMEHIPHQEGLHIEEIL